jgi:hypothetical protein
MLKKLRRWHFDLALFLGLAIFSWAYWYSKPRPVWTTYYSLKNNGARNNNFTILGYSTDSQSIYTTCETTELTKNWPIPQIQRWSTQTGELLEDYPVELPEADRFLLQLPRMNYGYSLSTTLCDDPRYILVRYEQSSKKDHNYIRLYRLDGKPVGQGLEVPRSNRIEYLTDVTHSDRHWVVSFELNSKKIEVPISVIDLDTGKPVRDPQIYTRDKLDNFPLVSAGRYLYFVLKATDTTPMRMEVVDLQTGESLGNIKTTRFPLLLSLDDQSFAVCSMIGKFDSFTSRVDFYRYDPQTKTMEPYHAHTLDGSTSAPMQWLGVEPPYLICVSRPRDQQNDPEIVKVILSWLARIGIVRNNIPTGTYRIADWTTGQPLRQITGFPEQGDHKTAPDWRSIVATATGPGYEHGLCLYAIPHYLWETTLSWMQWLSWLLVIPWPLRYFVQPHLTGAGIKTSPTH